MSKIIFFGFPVHGHVHPTLPVVRELCDRGEEVIYYANGQFEKQVRATGARFRHYGHGVLSDLTEIASRMADLPSMLIQASREVLDTELARVREDHPDAIVQDSMAQWGKCIARILELPLITSCSTFALHRRMMFYARGVYTPPKNLSRILAKLRSISRAKRIAREIRHAYGISPRLMELYFSPGDLNLVYTSADFQPFANRFAESFRFVGPSIGPRDEGIDFSWERMRGGTKIFISLGTIFNDEPDFYRRCFEGFGGEEYQVILSIGRGTPVESLARIPENFVVTDYVPQLEVLQEVDAFVTRGGMNSVSEALALGVPLVVVPHTAEQAVVAKRVVELGAGLLLKRQDVSGRRLRESVRDVLTDPEYRRRAKELGATIGETDGFRRAADEVQRFLARCGDR